MENQNNSNNDFIAKYVTQHLFGNCHATKSFMKNTGSSYGLRNLIPSDNYAIFQGIALPRLNPSFTIGLRDNPMNNLIMRNINILFMMAHIFTKTDALLI